MERTPQVPRAPAAPARPAVYPIGFVVNGRRARPTDRSTWKPEEAKQAAKRVEGRSPSPPPTTSRFREFSLASVVASLRRLRLRVASAALFSVVAALRRLETSSCFRDFIFRHRSPSSNSTWNRFRDFIFSSQPFRRLRPRVAFATLFSVVAALLRLRVGIASATVFSVIAAFCRLRLRVASAALASVVAALRFHSRGRADERAASRRLDGLHPTRGRRGASEGAAGSEGDRPHARSDGRTV